MVGTDFSSYMRTVKSLLPLSPPEKDFKALFARLGGKWIEEPSPGYGLLTEGDAALYVTFIPDVKNSIEMYSSKEIADFRRILRGLDPGALVSIDIGHG